jgi:hypothetical protein
MTEGGLLLEEEKEFRRFYKASLWWVTHRMLIVKIGYGAIIAIEIALFAFAAWSLLDSFALSFQKEETAINKMVSYGQRDLHAYTIANTAKDIEIKNVRVFSIGSARYDVYATIVNSNHDWWAEFEYAFGVGGEEVANGDGFILPGVEKPIAAFAIDSQRPITNAVLTINNVKWHRIDHHVISDYQQWSGDRLGLSVKNASFTTDERVGGIPFGRFLFDVTNNTAFSYYEPAFYLVLKRGSSVVGVTRTVLEELESGESASVKVSWFGTLPSVSDVEVIPEINIFDLNVYKPLEGEMTVDTRTRVFGRR